MKPTEKLEAAAFTRVELLVVAAVVAVLTALLMPALAQSRQTTQRLVCMNNLKVVGVAYRVWADSHGGRTPALSTMIKGGWQDLNGNALIGPGYGGNAGPACFTNYEIMQNELGQSPRIVLCPSDDRLANTNFYDPHWSAHGVPAGTGSFGNTNCSYWVGPGADASHPLSLLGGDRNMGGGAVREQFRDQDSNYGFSGMVGSTGGGDVQLATNGQILFGIASGGGNLQIGTYCQWSAKIHSSLSYINPTSTTGEGNILLGDGSVQQATSLGFRGWLQTATDLGNYGPSGSGSPGAVRLLFP